MKQKLLPLLICTLSTYYCHAQNRVPKKDQMPTPKEMNEMMAEIQKAMSEMSAEDKKMMDSLGFKMPNMPNIQQLGSFAAANANVSPGLLVPKKDVARISSIPATPLSTASLQTYLQSLHTKITAVLPAELLQKTNQQFELLRKNKTGKNLKAAAATGYWAFGNTRGALFLMSQACQENPADIHNISNLAAMLNMSGGEHLALPLLQLLNKQFPKNSTVLNNIAHAWFGLGDINNASKYIDSCIRLCAWHPQANQVKAAIEESKGNHDGAVKAMKQSISKMHTPEKERKLNDLGYELKSDDIHWGPRNTADQLGLSKFTWPAIPKSVEQSEDLEPVWNAFRKDYDDRMAVLKQQHSVLAAATEKALQVRMQHDIQAASTGARHSAMAEGIVPKAIIKLRPFVDNLMELEVREPFHERLRELEEQLRNVEEEYKEEMKYITENIKAGSEGTGANEAYCEAIDALNTKFVRNHNTLVENFCIDQKERAQKRIRETINLKMYSEFPEKFDQSIIEAKMEWLSWIMLPKDKLAFRSPIQFCQKSQKRPFKAHELSQFDEKFCNYRSKTDFVFASIETICGKTIAKIDVPHIKAEWEAKSADREQDRNFWDEFQRCTIEISAGYSREFGNGPLQLQVGAEATGFLEFDRTGLKDAGIKGQIGVGVTTNGLDTKIDTDIGEISVGPSEKSMSIAGAEAVISINSGFTAAGTGILSGVKF